MCGRPSCNKVFKRWPIMNTLIINARMTASMYTQIRNEKCEPDRYYLRRAVSSSLCAAKISHYMVRHSTCILLSRLIGCLVLTVFTFVVSTK